jgi:hypothetical protein
MRDARPKRTRKDKVHREIVSTLREAGWVIVETADLPAQGGTDITHPLDIFALTPERDLWLQAELKNDHFADFTESEIDYLKRMRVWPSPFVANIPIIAATSALDVERAAESLRTWRKAQKP